MSLGWLKKLLGREDSGARDLPVEQFGPWAERRVASYLKGRRWKILGRNYRTTLGEIDLVALDADMLVFVEVKAVRDWYGEPEAKVDRAKRQRLIRAAKAYIARHRLENFPARFDVVTLTVGADNTVDIDHEENAFEA